MNRAQRRARPSSRIGTHWAGCWRHHHACAIALVEELVQKMEEIDRVFRKMDEEMKAAAARRAAQ